MQTSELIVLQAFVLFLVVVRRVDDSRFCWTLTGLVIRIAQGMGLHRDGSQFDLTPFETEMRRRVWWAILVVDLRSAEELGTELTVTESMYDTRMPLNINDADISPTSTEFPTPSDGPSDTAIVLVRYQILSLSRKFIEDLASAPADIEPSEREKAIIDVYHSVEHKFLSHVIDETDSLYWVVAVVARIIMAKMCLHIYQGSMFPGRDSHLSDDIRDRIYVAAIEIVELGHKLNCDPRCKQYRWLFMTYTNWHAIAFNLIETCRRPWTALVERSWEAVSTFERDPVDLAKSGDHAAIFLPLRQLFFRARKHREAEIARLSANIDEARRLDWTERMNPAAARFGPVLGNENRMDQVREKWWSLIRPDGPNPAAMFGAGASHNSSVPPLANSSTGPASQIPTPRNNTQESEMTEQPEFQHAAMDMFDNIMAQPSIQMSSILPLNSLMFEKGFGMAMDGTNNTTDTQGQVTSHDNSLRQQALELQAQAASRDDTLPPYLWSHGWHHNTGSGKSPDHNNTTTLGDLDMEGDFNWADWGQSLQNFDMNGVQPPL